MKFDSCTQLGHRVPQELRPGELLLDLPRGARRVGPRLSRALALSLLGIGRVAAAEEPAQVMRDPASPAAPEDPSKTAQVDDYDLVFRSRLTVGGFQRALLPGPGGAIVTTDTLAPLFESLSVNATRVDGPLGKDGLDLQVAAYGQIWAGQPEDQPVATWDVSSAFLTQRIGDMTLSLGRQPIVGGAARYRRLDGAVVRGRTDFGLSAAAYGGLTVLPRWDQWYGYHHLGDAYEAWSSAPDSIVVPVRGENWMGGMHLGWADERIGMISASFHHQAENQSLADESMGLSVRLGGWSPVGLTGDAIYSLAQRRWSDVRFLADWSLAKDKRRDFGFGVRAEFLHTLPSALLSQASIFSVFSLEEVTEAGGELDFQLPYGLRVGLGGFGQDFGTGAPGARLRANVQLLTGEEQQTLLRLVASRVALEDNGYTQLRLAGRFPLWQHFTAFADVYQYFYDEPIRGYDTSTFASAHLGYVATEIWSARIGGSASQSPDAAMDVQVLAQLTAEWDRREQ